MLVSPAQMPHARLGPGIRPYAAAACLLALTCPAAAASFPTQLRFRSLDTSRVTVHFHQGLEPTARRAAALADEILAGYELRYHTSIGRVQIVLADVEDEPNGWATPLPYPLVHVRAAAPDGSDGLGNVESWLRLVLTHELAHVVHLNEARGLPGIGRKIFGRAPFLFPNVLTPGWMIEGLATYEETRGTAFGRGRDADAHMVLRMAVLERRFPGEDQPVLGLDRWPGGWAPYLFGESFLRDLSQRFGDDVLPEIVRVHAGRVIPFLDDLSARRVTGASFHKLWKEWRRSLREIFGAQAAHIRRAGLTTSTPLTRRGERQVGPRFSPGGGWLAYTSGTLSHYPAIRLVSSDGRQDHRLVNRSGGDTLAWTPDGRTLVYDEPEVEGVFAVRSGLRRVDVDSGQARWIARGLRARDPDVSPDGRRIIFVRRKPDRSELAVIAMDGTGLEDVTASAPETEWSGPRWSPSGDRIVAARWTPGGWLDIVLVDPARGEQRRLTFDRAGDIQPTFAPDGQHVIFSSDRDGVSNLYAVHRDGGPLLRLTNVLGGAFAPSASPDGKLAFARYSAAGYDVHVTSLDIEQSIPATPFVDPYPPPRPRPAPADGPLRPYRAWRAAWPRFWIPYAETVGTETHLGALTFGLDPLLRHAYGLEVHHGSRTERIGLRGSYQNDRYYPTFLLDVEDLTEPVTAPDGPARLRTRQLTLGASVPLRRSFRTVQSLSLAWRRERRSFLARPQGTDFGALEAAWSLSSVRRYPWAVSPVDGQRLRVAYAREDPALGSDVALGKLTADARAYLRVGNGHVLALRAGGGTTFGQRAFEGSFSLGGFPARSLLDRVHTNPGVLRGYDDDAFQGRHVAYTNVEYRLPLAHPQRGWRTFPAFVRHLHAALFVDAGRAWTGAWHWPDVKTAAGAALGADAYLGHGLPVTATLAVARGFGAGGRTRVHFRLGLSF